MSDKASNQSLSQWFNTAAFAAPAPFTYGNVAARYRTSPARTVQNLDFSLFKNFTVREKFKFQFRAEAFNLTNTPTFENPGHDFWNADVRAGDRDRRSSRSRASSSSA